MAPSTVLHLITGLSTGGAETMLLRLLESTDRTRFEPSVLSLMEGGEMAPRIERLGVSVRSLGMRRGVPDLGALARAAGILAVLRPRVVQSWLIHADLLAGLVGAIARVPVVWNVRYSVLDAASTPRLTRVVERSCAVLSRWVPRRVVCCSEASRRFAAGLGYDERKLLVIPNGFDISTFRPDPAARASVREELGIAPDALLVGNVARYDPNKDHRTLLEAAARVHRLRPDVHFLLCGAGVDARNAAITRQVSASGLDGVVHLMGLRHDVPRIQAALDVACLSSIGEGFPNVIGEAMACGVPCVVTDVGDSAQLVGETGVVAPPRSPTELADALLRVLALGRAERARLGSTARARIESRYDLRAITGRYEALYEEVMGERAA